MDAERDDPSLSLEGAVVEILERAGERVARIVLDAGTVVEIPAPGGDVTLGDRVRVDASLQIERVRSHAEIGESPDDALPLAPAPPAPLRFADYAHVLRMAALFAAGVVLFLVWRWWMVPPDFGVYGHFRAGAITDAAAARTPAFAGQAACVACHDDVQQARLVGRHRDIGCEACHGPLGAHARGDTDVAPVRPNARTVCLTCHVAKQGMAASFPKIVVKDHSEAGPCTECHQAHAPGLS